MTAVNQTPAAPDDIHTPTDKERVLASKLREAYEYLELAKRNLIMAFGDEPTVVAQPFLESGMNLSGYARGTLDTLITDLETGRYPFRTLQVDHPVLKGARGHATKDRT